VSGAAFMSAPAELIRTDILVKLDKPGVFSGNG
jgi:hypothetical protein